MEAKSSITNLFDWNDYKVAVTLNEYADGSSDYTWRITYGQGVLAESDTAFSVAEEAARDALLWLLENQNE